MKPPRKPDNESARLRALRDLGVMDSPPEQAFDDITRLATLITRAPMSLLSLVDDDRVWVKSAAGTERGETPRHISFCAHAVADDDALVVEDASMDERFRDNPLVTGEAHVRFYAGVPLRDEHGHVLGTLCVFGPEPHTLDSVQVEALETLASQASRHLSRRATERSLASAEQRFRDIEHELRAAKDEAERTSQIKSAFLANMSHELRTPLNAIIGFGKMLGKNKKSHLDDTELAWADRIRANGEQLLALINDLLDLSKIEAGRVSMALSDVSLVPLVRQLVEQIAPVAAEARTKIRLTAPDECAPIRADEQRFRQVLLNLVSNALKFGMGKPILIRLMCQGDTPIRLDVVDSGIGIPKDKWQPIFEPFRQADEGKARSHEGTGLGLAIARLLCREMHFDLLVDSVEGVGSTFSVMLSGDAPSPYHSEPSEHPEVKDARVTLNPRSSIIAEMMLGEDAES